MLTSNDLRNKLWPLNYQHGIKAPTISRNWTEFEAFAIKNQEVGAD